MIDQEKQKNITKTMQLILAILLISGIFTNSSKVVTNSLIGLIISFSPAILEKNYKITLNPFLALWITSAVFFHALGSFGLYGSITWWDHLTHALSSSVVAAIGYTTVRALDIHSDQIHLPKKFMFIFIILTVLAFGVIWEIFEYTLDIIAEATQIPMPLAQHGLEDTMKDMIYNTLGALTTATLGHIYLSQTSEDLLKQIKNRK